MVMTTPIYPPSLPKPEQGSFSESRLKTWVEDVPEVGAPRRRARFSRALGKWSFSLLLTGAEKETLLDFYKTTLGNGVDSFEWTHFTTGVVYIVEFTDFPIVRHNQEDIWNVDVELTEI
jgi:hypothetical protein